MAVLRFPKYASTVSAARGSDSTYDGFLIGAGGRLYPPGTTAAEVPAVQPAHRSAIGRALFVNGVLHDVKRACQSLQEIAEATGLELVGLYNAAEGVSDVFQAMARRFAHEDSRCSRALTAVVVHELLEGAGLHLLAYSQGGQVVSVALSDVRVALLKRGLMPGVVDERLSHLEVETFGSSCAQFPDGPRYRHTVNLADPVARGLVQRRGWLASLIHRRVGYGAALVTFRERPPVDDDDDAPPTHALAMYLRHRAR